MVDCHLISSIGEVVGDVRGMQEVVRKVFLDDVLLIARADDELLNPMMAVQLHDVP